jgi:multidrug resistance efflux pump
MPAPQDPHWLRLTGRVLGLAIIFGSLTLALVLARGSYVRPRTDDANVRANVIGIAPNVSGPIAALNVVDNQDVAEGTVLFTIDPQPFKVALARAQAALAQTKVELAALKIAVSSAEAEVQRLTEASGYASDHAKRLQTLAAQKAIDEDTLEQAQMAARTAVSAVQKGREELARQQALLGEAGAANAQLQMAEAAVSAAQLNLNYCEVRAPFPCRVTNLNIAQGQYATAGQQVFTLVDTRTWYVIANFQETYLESIRPGMEAEVLLLSYPGQRFRGRVEGVGWAVLSGDGAPGTGVPEVAQTLNWVRLAQRLPVRIQLDAPVAARPYRMGMSAVVTLLPAAKAEPAP